MEKLPFAVARARRLAFVQLAAATTVLVAIVTPFMPSPGEAVDAALVVWVLAVVAVPYVLWRVGRRVRRHWNAFELAIGAETVRAAAKGEGRVTIRRDEVARIVEHSTGLVVYSSQAGVSIRVPRTVESYLDARARLGALRPIVSRSDALVWCLAVAATGFACVVVPSLWELPPGVGGGLAVCQLAIAVFATFEIAAQPGISRAGRSLALAAVGAGGITPLVGLLPL